LVKATDLRGHFSIIGFSHPIRAEVLAGMDEQTLYSGMHLVDSAENRHSAGDAVVALMVESTVPLSWIGALAIRNDTVRRAIASTYSTVARNRSRLARLVPDVAPITVRR
jgi:hypothetical protein